MKVKTAAEIKSAIVDKARELANDKSLQVTLGEIRRCDQKLGANWSAVVVTPQGDASVSEAYAYAQRQFNLSE